MTLCLVWHWTGHYGGSAAHRYFIRWFLAWFLTQKIPLTFASLPYRGGRYTITSMYAFLNYKYYLGGSFASWYWHYAAWGAVLTGLIEAAVVAVLFVRTSPSEAVHIRGITLVPARKLARKLGGRAGLRLAGIRIPRALECQHFLVAGSTGSGKSHRHTFAAPADQGARRNRGSGRPRVRVRLGVLSTRPRRLHTQPARRPLPSLGTGV